MEDASHQIAQFIKSKIKGKRALFLAKAEVRPFSLLLRGLIGVMSEKR